MRTILRASNNKLRSIVAKSHTTPECYLRCGDALLSLFSRLRSTALHQVSWISGLADPWQYKAFSAADCIHVAERHPKAGDGIQYPPCVGSRARYSWKLVQAPVPQRKRAFCITQHWVSDVVCGRPLHVFARVCTVITTELQQATQSTW